MAEISTLNGYKIKDKKAIRYYNTVADMIADTTLKSGMHVKTSGYYAINDGGNAEYKIVSNEDISNNDFKEDLSNELKAKLIIKDNKINVKQLGAKDDGTTDNTNIFQEILDKRVELYVPKGNYLLSSSLKLYINSTIIGQSQTTTIITCESNFNDRTGNEEIDHITIKNLRIIGNDQIDGLDLSGTTQSPYTGGRYSIIENVTFNNFNIAAILKGVWCTNFINCRFNNNIIGVKQMGTCNNIVYDKCKFYGQDTYFTDSNIGLRISSDQGSENYNITLNQCDFEKLNNAIYAYNMVDLALNSLYVEKIKNTLIATNVIVGKIYGGIFNNINRLIYASATGSNFLINSSFDVKDISIINNTEDNLDLISTGTLKCTYENVFLHNKGNGILYVGKFDRDNNKYTSNCRKGSIISDQVNIRYSTDGYFTEKIFKKDFEKLKLVYPKLVFKSAVTLSSSASIILYVNNVAVCRFNINAGTYAVDDVINASYENTDGVLFDNLSELRFRASTGTSIDCNAVIETDLAIGEMTKV